MRTNRKYCRRLRAFQMRIKPFSRNAVHVSAFSREAAQDRSPWVERSETLGETPRGANPARGAGKQPLDSDGGSIRPVPKEIQRLGSSSPKPSARQASSPASLSAKGSAPANKHPQLPRNCPASGIFQPEKSRKKSNTYYKRNHQTTYSYTTYGNTRGAEKGKIAKTLSYPDIFCQKTT